VSRIEGSATTSSVTKVAGVVVTPTSTSATATTVAATSATAAPTTTLSADPAADALTAMTADARALVDPGRTAAAVAHTLQLTEQSIRNVKTPRATAFAAGRLQQLAYRRLAGHPDWVPSVLAALTPPVKSIVQRNLAAADGLRSIKSGPAPDLMPGWTILSPASATKLLGWYHAAGKANGIGWQYLAAINLVETRIGRISGVSSAGAKGPMQFLPSTWKDCCTGKITDPHDAIFGAAKYLRLRGGASNIDKGIFGYNPSKGYLAAVKAYASVLVQNERAFYGYYSWQVFVSTTAGDFRLPEGYSGAGNRLAAADYGSAHPQDKAP
jgi:hypothetical protein